MDCPVCQNSQIEEGASHCSNCNSDLSAFTLIKEVESNRSGLRKSRMIVVILLLLVVAAWGGTYATGSQSVAQEEEQLDGTADKTDTKDEQISTLMAEVAQQKEKIEQLDGELVELLTTIENEADESGNFTVHVVQKGESLWRIAEQYHGDGNKHEHIADHNEIDQPHYIKVGDTIIIKH
ncbi:MAG: LysM repeat protein [Vicingaceae bacterium]|jgi:LysM repeat protein